MRGEGGRSRICIARRFRAGGEKGDEALASLRAAVVPGGDIVLESTPNGAGGLFTRSGSGRRRRDIRGIFFRGGLKKPMCRNGARFRR